MNAQYAPRIRRRDFDADLEHAFISEYLRDQGYNPDGLDDLPEELVKALLAEASVVASGRLTEIEARASFVAEVQGMVESD